MNTKQTFKAVLFVLLGLGFAGGTAYAAAPAAQTPPPASGPDLDVTMDVVPPGQDIGTAVDQNIEVGEAQEGQNDALEAQQEAQQGQQDGQNGNDSSDGGN